MDIHTIANTKIFIGSKAVRGKGNVTIADFALVEWIEILGLYNVGELGGEQTINEFELIAEEWTRKAKGGRNGGTMQNQFVPDALDPGQIQFLAAIEDKCGSYPFKVEYAADCTPTSEVAISVGAPAVITWANHGLFGNQPVMFSTDDALPTGLVAEQIYYVLNAGKTDDTFSVSAAPGGAAIATTAAGTGVQTITAPPAGMTKYFQGKATDGALSGGTKNDGLFQTWNIAVDGRIVSV